MKKWVTQYEKGDFLGVAGKRNRVTLEQGRPTKYKELKEALYEFPLNVARTRGGRCGSNLLRSKLIAVVRSNEQDYPEAMCDGAVSPVWATKKLCAFMEEYGLARLTERAEV